MVQWTVSDELDARLRSHLARRGGDLTTFVEQVIEGQFAYEDDAQFRAEVLAKVKQGMAEIDAGRGIRDRDALRKIAQKHRLKLPG